MSYNNYYGTDKSHSGFTNHQNQDRIQAQSTKHSVQAVNVGTSDNPFPDLILLSHPAMKLEGGIAMVNDCLRDCGYEPLTVTASKDRAENLVTRVYYKGQFLAEGRGPIKGKKSSEFVAGSNLFQKLRTTNYTIEGIKKYFGTVLQAPDHVRYIKDRSRSHIFKVVSFNASPFQPSPQAMDYVRTQAELFRYVDEYVESLKCGCNADLYIINLVKKYKEALIQKLSGRKDLYIATIASCNKSPFYIAPKINVKQLFESLEKCGGKSMKFKIIPPSGKASYDKIYADKPFGSPQVQNKNMIKPPPAKKTFSDLLNQAVNIKKKIELETSPFPDVILMYNPDRIYSLKDKDGVTVVNKCLEEFGYDPIEVKVSEKKECSNDRQTSSSKWYGCECSLQQTDIVSLFQNNFQPSCASRTVYVLYEGVLLAKGQRSDVNLAHIEAGIDLINTLRATNYVIEIKNSYFNHNQVPNHIQKVDPSQSHIYKVVCLKTPEGPSFPCTLSGAVDYVTSEDELWSYLEQHLETDFQADLYILNLDPRTEGILTQSFSMIEDLITKNFKDTGIFYISPRLSIKQVYESLKKCGGENIKYRIVAPSRKMKRAVEKQQIHHENQPNKSNKIVDCRPKDVFESQSVDSDQQTMPIDTDVSLDGIKGNFSTRSDGFIDGREENQESHSINNKRSYDEGPGSISEEALSSSENSDNHQRSKEFRPNQTQD